MSTLSGASETRLRTWETPRGTEAVAYMSRFLECTLQQDGFLQLDSDYSRAVGFQLVVLFLFWCTGQRTAMAATRAEIRARHAISDSAVGKVPGVLCI